MAEPRVACGSRERHAQVLREPTTWQIKSQPGCRILTPGAGVRDIWRKGITGGDADRVADFPVAADNRFPIIDAVRLAGKPLSGIGEISHAEIQIDSRDLRADAACGSQLSGWVGRQVDGSDGTASV